MAAGHFGNDKRGEGVQGNFYWPHITEWITDYLQSYDECRYHKSVSHKKYGLLQRWETPYARCVSISTAFVVQLGESRRYTQTCVVVDCFTKMAHYIALRESATASVVAWVFLDNIRKIHGLPMEKPSDRDTNFTREFWMGFCKLLKIKSSNSTAYHPQTDGQSKWVNWVMEANLQNLVNHN